MPPRRSARRAGAGAADAPTTLDSLPPTLLLHILALLPADTRLRCAELSRAFRAVVAEPSLWRALDFSAASGVSRPVSAALLHAAAARARGGLRTLDVSGCDLRVEALCAVLRANAGVTQLCVLSDLDEDPVELTHHDTLRQLLRAAPALTSLRADARCMPAGALELLGAAPPFGPLHLRALRLESFPPHSLRPLQPALGDAATHPSLHELVFASCGSITAEALEIIVDMALARQLPALRFAACSFERGCVAHLTRAVADGALRELVLDRCSWWEEALPFADALRGNATLTSLTLRGLRGPVAAALLSALRDHASLRTLNAHNSRVASAPGVARALALAAGAPALTSLDVTGCGLSDAGLGALLDALAANTTAQLHTLRCQGNAMSAAFARQRLLPAVRAHALLRTLAADVPNSSAVREAMALLARR